MFYSELYKKILEHEIFYNVFVQNHFAFLEPLMEILSEECGPAPIINYGVPILGAYNMNLMTKSVLIMGLINLICNIMKWICYEDRPYWWAGENNGPHLNHYHITCEPTSGFPSGHSSSFTAFACIVAFYLNHYFQQKYPENGYLLRNITYLLLGGICVFMWIIRLYFACHFLHQCIFASLLSFWAVKYLHRVDVIENIFTWEKQSLILILFILGAIVVSFYFINLQFGVDPHLSVRMAFKWCQNPDYLKHENSPVYSLGKDFGYLFGVFLAAPLLKRAETQLNPYWSGPVTLIIIIANYVLDRYTPMRSGRLAFTSYGFARNMMFSLSLLVLLPTFAGKIKTD